MEDELLMTLMRIRPAREEQDLAYHFGVSQSTVSRITSMWINFLYLRLGLIPIWPKWQDVEETMPASFKETYPSPLPSLTRRDRGALHRVHSDDLQGQVLQPQGQYDPRSEGKPDRIVQVRMEPEASRNHV